MKILFGLFCFVYDIIHWFKMKFSKEYHDDFKARIRRTGWRIRVNMLKRGATIGSKAHFGDPCIYCGVAWDKVNIGDCPKR